MPEDKRRGGAALGHTTHHFSRVERQGVFGPRRTAMMTRLIRRWGRRRCATPMNLTTLTTELRRYDDGHDERSWPEGGVRALGEAGCWRNVVSAEFGGVGASPEAQLETYEAVARGSLSLALILTQHDAACELLGDCDNEALMRRLLPRCARGEVLTTVGISQLTTSRRAKGPAMRADPVAEGFRLTGFMPWVTSAPKADYVVTGAVLPDGQQVLACVSTSAAGLSTGEPMELMALGSSWTSEIRCDGVVVTSEHLIRGPLERVLARRAPVKPLSVSAVGVGMAGALLDGIRACSGASAQAADMLEKRIMVQYESVRRRLFDAAETLSDPSAEIPSMDIRVAVNDLVVRLAATLLTFSKGSGYLSSHRSQRLVREAMFLLVWSAPPHVQLGTLEKLW